VSKSPSFALFSVQIYLALMTGRTSEPGYGWHTVWSITPSFRPPGFESKLPHILMAGCYGNSKRGLCHLLGCTTALDGLGDRSESGVIGILNDRGETGERVERGERGGDVVYSVNGDVAYPVNTGGGTGLFENDLHDSSSSLSEIPESVDRSE
jgi:hypothetical protein